MPDGVELAVGNRDAVADGRGGQLLALLENAAQRARVDGRLALLPAGQKVGHFGQDLRLARAPERGDDGVGSKKIDDLHELNCSPFRWWNYPVWATTPVSMSP